MSGTKLHDAIVHSAEKIAESVEKTDTSGKMGITGLKWTNIGNLSAMTIICAAFIYLGREVVTQSKEDRAMFRDSLKEMQASQDRRWERTDTSHGKAMEKMGMIIDKSVTQMDTTTRTLTDAVREMKDATNVVKAAVGKMP